MSGIKIAPRDEPGGHRWAGGSEEGGERNGRYSGDDGTTFKLVASWFLRMLRENAFFQMQMFSQASFMGSFTNTG